MDQTRRRILQTAAATTVAATVGGLAGATAAAASPGEHRGRIPDRGIGMHLYTVRDILAADPLGTLRAMAEIGYACVGVSAFPRPAAEIRDLCRETRLNPVILHVGHGDITGNWENKLADAQTIGVRWVVLSSFPGGRRVRRSRTRLRLRPAAAGPGGQRVLRGAGDRPGRSSRPGRLPTPQS